ncbi:MAG: carboxynorspermidine decarboxylase [Gammaproteobacteria bacterium]|nr:carboxynorspermidine decarboxylase [Gammaproteobacteria bacterium]
METQAGDPGAFRAFDLHRVPSPCFVVDRARLEQNLQILADVKQRSGAKVLLALKAFSMWSLADLVGEYLDGTCASGLWEATLAKEKYHGELTTFSAAYKTSEIDAIAELSDHLLFNSPAQLAAYADRAEKHCSLGLRINPEHSEGEVEKYDPCAPCSRLGTPLSQLGDFDWSQIDGIHMHTLCEQGFEPLERTFAAVERALGGKLHSLKWINFGGGHHITRADYDREALVEFLTRVQHQYGVQAYIEPGEAVALDTGILIGEILDLPENSMSLAITDLSATCHMPDVIEAPYRPALLDEPDAGHTYRLGGPSCLAGDVIGDYTFAEPLKVGQRIAFLDQAHYSMVKTNTFNGIALPSIAIWDSATDALTLQREFSYSDFRDRLS